MADDRHDPSAMPDPPAPPIAQDAVEPDDRLDRLVDLQSAGSFPASDPPSFWAGVDDTR